MPRPEYLEKYSRLGQIDGHMCFLIERRIYAFYVEGHFSRKHLDALVGFVRDSPGFTQPYVTIALSQDVAGYDSDLRTVMSDPGELREMKSMETIVVTDKPLNRMVVRTMALAGRAAGNPGGVLAAASTFEEALVRARQVVQEILRG